MTKKQQLGYLLVSEKTMLIFLIILRVCIYDTTFQVYVNSSFLPIEEVLSSIIWTGYIKTQHVRARCNC